MNTLLNNALILTLIGMGMTFAALGLLVVGMYALTAFIKERVKEKKGVLPPAPSMGEKSIGTGDARYIAAAAVVSTALASQSDKTIAAVAAVATTIAANSTAAMPAPEIPGAWNMHVRGRHLTQRKYYDARRLHR